MAAGILERSTTNHLIKMSLNGITLDDDMLAVVINTLGDKNLALKKQIEEAKVVGVTTITYLR